MSRLLIPALILSLAASACAANAAGTTAPLTDPAFGTPSTDAARRANETMRAVPDGYGDCGATNLTSGWPTTTVFLAEVGAECNVDAAESGVPSQQAFNGRDNAGGIDGTIIRVDGIDAITMVTYHVDPTGAVSKVETTCRALDSPPFEPPTCPQP